jgi:hypothetical protein
MGDENPLRTLVDLLIKDDNLTKFKQDPAGFLRTNRISGVEPGAVAVLKGVGIDVQQLRVMVDGRNKLEQAGGSEALRLQMV